MTLEFPDDMVPLVAGLGYYWPVDDAPSAARQRADVIIGILGTVRFWRERCDEAERGVRREQMYQHLSRRLEAVSRRLKNVRRAAKQYRACKDFEEFCRACEQWVVPVGSGEGT